MTVPGISIVVPVHNGERFLEEALASVKSQTFSNFEILIVNDRSTDRTVEIVKVFCRNEPRARLLDADGPGISRTRNTGIRVARAPWIAFLDHDDLWDPQKLARQLEFLRSHSGTVALGTWARYIGVRGHVAGLYALGSDSIEAFRAQRKRGEMVHMLTSSALVHRETVLKCGCFHPELKAAEDVTLWNQLADHGPVLSLREPLASYRVHPTGASASHLGFQRRVCRFIEHNLRARNAGRSELSFAEFLKLPSESGLLARLEHRRRDLGSSLYRKAGGCVADGRWFRGGFALALAVVLYPSYVLGKLRRQKLSGRTRVPNAGA